jgi:hypothetical protein
MTIRSTLQIQGIILTMKNVVCILLLFIANNLSAGSNEETLQYIISDYQDQCEKAQEDFRDIDYEEGDPVVA